MAFDSERACRDLVAAAEQLLFAARSPEEIVFAVAQQPAQMAIALGLPDALPVNGDSRSLGELLRALGAEDVVGYVHEHQVILASLRRILRACTFISLLSELSKLCYAYTAVLRMLLSLSNRALVTLMFDYDIREVIALLELLQARK
ncbi:hypothetical protein F5X98DRAFT_381470 [Xylaria grammica]|nr:hypothetical protein F5X98DRAFT_381470 [Xylaria grammica]